MSTTEVHGWLVEMPEVRSCTVCAHPTAFVDYALRVPLCRGTCTTRARVDSWVEQARRGGVSAGQG